MTDLDREINQWLDLKGITGSTRETYLDAMRQARAQYDSIAEMVKRYIAARESWPCFFKHTDGRFYALGDSDDLEEFESFQREQDINPNQGNPEPDEFPEKPEGFTLESLNDIHGNEWLEVERGSDEPDEDDERVEMENNALSVEVRSDWHSPGESAAASEFQILLCTGGPAVRITGGLGDYLEPEKPTLEFQGWFIAWQELPGFLLPDDSDEVLTEYCSVFYFGE